MVGQIVLYVIIIGLLALLGKIVIDAQRKEKWFRKLKPGDHINVWIYSNYCECIREAIVTKPAVGKYIGAKIIDLNICKDCSEINSKDKNNVETCWYKVEEFDKKDIGKI